MFNVSENRNFGAFVLLVAAILSSLSKKVSSKSFWPLNYLKVFLHKFCSKSKISKDTDAWKFKLLINYSHLSSM